MQVTELLIARIRLDLAVISSKFLIPYQGSLEFWAEIIGPVNLDYQIINLAVVRSSFDYEVDDFYRYLSSNH